LIAQSRASLNEKATALKKIAENYRDIETAAYEEQFDAIRYMADMSLRALNIAREKRSYWVFILTQYWVDDEVIWINDGKKFFGDYYKSKSLPFSTFEQAVNHINDKNSAIKSKAIRW
jgi:hypothetical protein